jgi:PTH2 family peptidyl-tRNA hydrolase
MTDTAKQVIVLRNDLGMRKGKMVAQGAHASMGALLDLGRVQKGKRSKELVIPIYDEIESWLVGSFIKVCVRCDSEQELLDLHQEAKRANLPCKLITDAGRTEFNGVPTKTAVAIGPGPASKIDKITGHLKLL